MTTRFRAAITEGHEVVTVVEVMDPASPGVPLLALDALDGTVTVDRNASVRRRCQVQVRAGDLLPMDLELGQPGLYEMGATGDVFGAEGDVLGALEYTTTAGLLAPYGTEIRVSRGIRHWDGVVELCPLGVFRLSEASIDDDGPEPTLSLSGYDRARTVSRARWTDVYVVAAGTNYSAAIQALLTNRVPGLTFEFAVTDRLTPQLVFGEERSNDPWLDAQKMARNIGCELFFNGAGVCVLRPEPTGYTDPTVWSLTDGVDGTLVQVARRLSDEPGYNGVVVCGEGTELVAPVRAEAWDDNPSSPTYRGGPYGRVPRFYTSAFITTEAQAQDVANSMLTGVLGADEEVSVDIIPMPALDESDLVHVRRAPSRLNSPFRIESTDIPLSPSATQRVTLRRRRSGEEET